jgi:Zn-dependent M28 family amino/carboxypeptidase
MNCQRSQPLVPAKLRRLPRLRAGAPLLLATLLVAACGGGDDGAAPTERAQAASSCASRSNDNVAKLLECVTLAGVRAHQATFQAIADAHGGTRAAGTSGYDASLNYVKQRMEAAGYQVTLNEFAFEFTPPVLLTQLSPLVATYESGAFTGGGIGDVTAAVTPVDINLAPPRLSTSGCEASDFAGFPAGNIALVQRGTCSFAIKALNAAAAGASAVIIFNQGNDSTRLDLIVGTLAPDSTSIPVVGASFAAGTALAEAGSTARVKVEAPRTIAQYNVIAESRDGDPNNVVMVGAHLDSVQRGPGINDNGSGSAAILEVAVQMAKAKPRNKLRFAWWGAEESGLLGSTAYVAGLSEADRAKIALYLNFDMVGSPNHVFFIYDGDDSDAVGAGSGPLGSAAIEKTFERYYTERGIAFKGTDFTGRSDYGPFIAQGIPAGGLFTGAEGLKTAQEAATWGGVAGTQYDPCYHLACDTYDNNNDYALDVNADAVAYAALKYAMTTADVNDQKSKGNFKKLVVPYPALPAR